MGELKCPRCNGDGVIKYNNTLGDLFRMHREARQLGQREAARGIGMSSANYNHLENNKHKDPQFSNIVKICKFYEIDLNVIADIINN